jgi:hypothetical protein
MNGDTITNNQKVLQNYAQKLASNDLTTFTRTAEKFGAWLKSERAYYPAARPQVCLDSKTTILSAQAFMLTDFDV